MADWLAVMDEAGANAAAVQMRPKPTGNAKDNDRAIAQLEAKLKTVSGKAYPSAIKGLLLALYQKQGMKDKAAALAAELSGKPAPPNGAGAKDQLRGLEVQLGQGKAAALSKAEGRSKA